MSSHLHVQPGAVLSHAGQIFSAEVRYEVSERIDFQHQTFYACRAGFGARQGHLFVIANLVAHGGSLPALGEPCRYWRKYVATVKRFAQRLEKIVFRSGVAHDHIWFAFVNEGEHAVIGRDEVMILAADEKRAPFRSD